MCGIFGIVATKGATQTKNHVQSLFANMMNLSASRGKEAAGLALSYNGALHVYKVPFAAHQLTRSSEFQAAFESVQASDHHAIAIIGHSRLVTNGNEDDSKNNQPVGYEGVVGVHNGIVVNDAHIWAQHPHLTQHTEVDTEVIVALTANYLKKTDSIMGALQQVYTQLEGAASIGLLFQHINSLALATNTGSLYFYSHPVLQTFLFTSEHYIMQQLLDRWNWLKHPHPTQHIEHLQPGYGALINLETATHQTFSLANEPHIHQNVSVQYRSAQWPIRVHAYSAPATYESPPSLRKVKAPIIPQRFYATYEQAHKAISNLKRCTRCILPETMPFISFDDAGVCNYCREYVSMPPLGREKLEELVVSHRRQDGHPDCLVMLSGGRDSSYGLHYIKRELGMNPIAFTYDWGMITDIARRNASRMCAKLGVEQILLSADIRKKRRNIQNNIQAWLKRPSLGMIPIFMAGDKQFFYYANQVRNQIDVPIVFYLTNRRLEKTLFKSGFCGVYESLNDQGTYYIDQYKKLRLLGYNVRELVLNPHYLNSSIGDTLFGFYSAYISAHKMVQLYRYIMWDEEEIENVLISQYNWELDQKTSTSWRIGDGTAAFYNYIYYLLAGFSENDTFLSNQIREGLIDRQRALDIAEERNRPRFDSIYGYCEIIGIDFENTLDQINAVSRRYTLK